MIVEFSPYGRGDPLVLSISEEDERLLAGEPEPLIIKIRKSAMKYNTLAELKAAYESGELTHDDPVWIDNDTVFLYDYDEVTEESGEQLFESHPAQLLTDALNLLGIPWDHV